MLDVVIHKYGLLPGDIHCGHVRKQNAHNPITGVIAECSAFTKTYPVGTYGLSYGTRPVRCFSACCVHPTPTGIDG
jgi:hypothetical protein